METDLLLFPYCLYHSVEKRSVQRNSFVNLDKNRQGSDAFVNPVQHGVCRFLKRSSQLTDNIFQRHHQGQLGIVENLQIFYQVFA